jgi:hypothetical protein
MELRRAVDGQPTAPVVMEIGRMSIDELVNRFAEIAIAQNSALLHDERRRFKRLFQEMNDVDDELKRRGSAARLELTRLYQHPNLQVRVKAAKRTLAVAPDDARKVLEALQASGEQPQALEAGMSLHNLDRGVFKPT